MGILTGRARVGGRLVLHGTMTFALGPKPDGRSEPARNKLLGA